MALDKLRILRLEAENVKRLVAVEISPKGDLIEVSGKNGNGKTSVLDCILWALAGGREIQWKPIRAGEEKAFIKLDLGDDEGLKLQVVRRFTAQPDGKFSTSLKVTNAEGFRPDGEQTLLNRLIGALSFDPGEFIRAESKDQIAILKSIIPGDFDAIAKRRKEAFTERTDVNREESRLRNLASRFMVGDDAPSEPIDTSALMERLQSLGKLASEAERERGSRRLLANRIEGWKDERASHLKRIEALRSEILEYEQEAKKLQGLIDKETKNLGDLPPVPDVPDAAEIRAELDKAESHNAQVRERLERDEVVAQADAQKKLSEELTATIERCDAEVKTLIGAANLPVRGLELTDDGVYLRGVPFNQASDAEQLRASMALCMAANPSIRVIRIRDGSLLDDDALQVIRDVAKDEGFQIWMERVGRGSGVGEEILLENGMIKAVP